jgi:hypothetical protein
MHAASFCVGTSTVTANVARERLIARKFLADRSGKP